MANDDVRDIISILFDALGMRKYIGMRYVPIFGRLGETSMEWDNTKPYEQLTVVLYNGNSYTSKQFVPIGVDISNTDFWALSGNYNAQVEEYKQAADSAAEEAHTATENVDRLESLLPDTEFTSENTVKNYVDSLDYIENIYNSNSFEIMYDGYVTSINSFVTILKLPIQQYAMNQFIPYSTMQAETNYSKKFASYLNTIFCAPNLESDYFIRDGEATGITRSNTWCFLCVHNDNTYSILESYGQTPNANSLIQNGVKHALFVWEPIIINNIEYDITNIPINAGSRDTILNYTHPRFVIGWDSNNTYLISVSGSIPMSKGATHANLVTLLNEFNIPNGINCDGGGSAQLWLCPLGYNLTYTRNVTAAQMIYPNNSRAKPMTGFSLNIQ